MTGAAAGGTRLGEQAGAPVFISYARVASKEQVRALHAELSGHDELAFLDESDIELREHYPPVLVDALLASRVTVIFASEEYFRRWYCQWELDVILSPYLVLSERGTEQEQGAALAPVIVALPPEGVAVPPLSALPPLLRNANWLRAGETKGLAGLIRQQLAAESRTLEARLEAAGQSSARLRSRLLEEVALPSPGSLAGVPYYLREFRPSLGTSFVGRSTDLWRIHRALSARHNQPGEGAKLAAAVMGGGGFGKTRLVLEYLHRFGPSHYPGGLFWVNADVTEDRLEEEFHGILRTLKPETQDLVPFRESRRNAAEELTRALDEAATRGHILYVVDNVPEVGPDEVPKPLRTWCPALGKVSLLLTSRTSMDLGTESIHALPLATLMPDAAVALLTDGVSGKGLRDLEWRQIAEWVGFLPLALELLNRTLRVGLRPESLLARARDQGPVGEMERQMKLLRRHVPAGALRGCAEAFSISYERLSEAERLGARLIAWLSPEVIPWKLLVAIGPEVSSEEVYTTLLSRHFVTPMGGDSGSMFGSMHRVLADYLRGQSPEPQRELKQVCQGLLQVMESADSKDPTTWPLMDACLPHAESVFEWLSKDDATSDVSDEVSLGLSMEVFLHAKGLARQAQAVVERVVDRAAEKLGAEHPDTLTAMHDLAATLRAQGKLGGAYKYEARVLKLRTRVLGEEHPDTLTTMGNLASTLAEQGNFSEAREYEERVLEVRKRVQGKEHPATLTAMGNLAGTLFEQGDRRGALRYDERVLKARKRVLGKEHPDTLSAMANLAVALCERGDFGRARRYQERVLEVRKRMLGENHPATLTAMANLGRTLHEQGELGAARRYQERALEMEKRILGEEHPDTLTAMGNLAATLSAQGNLNEAREYEERVLEVRKRVLGKEHPDTLMAMDNLAATLCLQEDFSRARRYQERVLEVRKRVLGEEHPHTLTSMANLSATLFSQEDFNGARGVLERVLRVSQRVLGAEHPSTLAAMGGLAVTLFAEGDLDEARRYQARVVKVKKRILGAKHPGTLVEIGILEMILDEQRTFHWAQELTEGL